MTPDQERTARAAAAFTESVVDAYERCLGPMFFAPYAADIAERARGFASTSILETAAGTGIVTRALAAALPRADVEATDLNAAMIDRALVHGGGSARWSVADAMALPFENGRFDLVVCQFGVMFFADRPRAFRETRRVLAPGGRFLFNVWDGLAFNDVARVVSTAVCAAFPNDPPRFVERVPHGHGDPAAIERDLRVAGFDDCRWESVTKRSIAVARDAAAGLCEGTPLRSEILARDARGLPDVVRRTTEALVEAFGGEAIDGAMRAFVFEARNARSSHDAASSRSRT